jgi:hypothetical protein
MLGRLQTRRMPDVFVRVAGIVIFGVSDFAHAQVQHWVRLLTITIDRGAF